MEQLSPERRNEFVQSICHGSCPFCGKDGFANILLHISLSHSVKARDLREYLQITFVQSVCSQELSGRLSSRAGGRNPRMRGTLDPSKRVYSTAGAKIRNSNLSPPLSNGVSIETLRENGRLVGRGNKGRRPWNARDDHGRRAMYRRGCRCCECSAANREFWAIVNARRSAKENKETDG